MGSISLVGEKLRFEFILDLAADDGLGLEGNYHYYKGYHEKSQDIKKEVTQLVVA